MKIGDKYKVIKNTSDHYFEIGEIVTVDEISIPHISIVCSNGTDYWFLASNELEEI